MIMKGSLHPWIAGLVFLFLFSLQWPRGTFASGNVTMESIEIFRTHEFFRKKPTVYFRCQGENKRYLPDVKEKNNLYIFKGEESWQPLATLLDRKCKRCGLYEEDALTSDDTFDEWELCPDEFSPPPEGRYKRFKEKEFNATFLCSQCNVSESGTAAKPTTTDPINPNSAASAKRNFNSRLGIVILCASFVVLVAIVIVLYKLWEKKKREEQQARFLKLFEEDDDLEVELGLRDEL